MTTSNSSSMRLRFDNLANDYSILTLFFPTKWNYFVSPQLSEVLLSALNQNLVQFTLRPGVQVTVYAAHLSAGNQAECVFRAAQPGLMDPVVSRTEDYACTPSGHLNTLAYGSQLGTWLKWQCTLEKESVISQKHYNVLHVWVGVMQR